MHQLLTKNQINRSLNDINIWLKHNKLSLNVDKSKYMIFHNPQKKFKKPKLCIDSTEIELVNTFNFLGLEIDSKLSWSAHTTKIQNKISRAMGVINRLKNFLPTSIKVMLYNALILPHINFNILLWGQFSSRIFKLQKKIMRILVCSKYNAHTEPIFKSLNMLKIEDIYTISKLKFYYKHVHNKLPFCLQKIPIQLVSDIHRHATRNQNKFSVPRVNHHFANNAICYKIPKCLNDVHTCVLEKVNTHSLSGFNFYLKRYYIDRYSLNCLIDNCYICQHIMT